MVRGIGVKRCSDLVGRLRGLSFVNTSQFSQCNIFVNVVQNTIIIPGGFDVGIAMQAGDMVHGLHSMTVVWSEEDATVTLNLVDHGHTTRRM